MTALIAIWITYTALVIAAWESGKMAYRWWRARR